MLQSVLDAVRKKLQAVTRWTGFNSLNMVFFVVLAMLFLIKKCSTFHLLKLLSCEAQHFSKDFCNACYLDLLCTKV